MYGMPFRFYDPLIIPDLHSQQHNHPWTEDSGMAFAPGPFSFGHFLLISGPCVACARHPPEQVATQVAPADGPSWSYLLLADVVVKW